MTGETIAIEASGGGSPRSIVGTQAYVRTAAVTVVDG